MRFEMLGPLRVWVGSSEVAVTAGRERTLLAVLLLHAGSTVPVGRLVEAIWSGEPPRSARNQVQTSVSLLRHRLTTAGASADLIGTEPAGYRIRTDPGQLDVTEFRTLVGRARAAAAAGQRPEARERYRAAAALWHGSALAGMDGAVLRRMAQPLDEERVQAIEECIEVELALGGGGELVGELTELVGEHPYREGLHAALMRALYRAGRPADALAAYRRAGRLLRDELGTEPGEQLQRLHQTILNQDPPDGPDGPATPALLLPRELPAEASCFVGRAAEIERVRQVLSPGSRGARRRPAVVLLYGPGGVGKSALAVRIGHEVAPAFSNGQLYVDLCGSTPGMSPLPVVEVLGRFLRRLGVPAGQVPASEPEAAALFRSATTDQRLLVVLDNAADHEQVASLIPSGPHCGVLVTCRRSLAGLDADDRLRVEVLSDTDGLELLRGLTHRVKEQPAAARQILSLSGGLPLAIRVAAGRLASRPDLPVGEYAERLANRSRRLDELQLDDLAVRACIRTSYDALLAEGSATGTVAARAFRMLGLLHVPHVAPGVVAAMLGEPGTETARGALDRLVDAQLLEPMPEGRYRLHDLVRLVATERAEAVGQPADRERSVERAIAYYTTALHSADAELRRGRTLPFGPVAAPDDLPLPVFGSAKRARAWTDAELPNLVPALEQAISMGGGPARFGHWLSDALWVSLEVRCEWRAAYVVSQRLLEAGERWGDIALAACGALLHGRSEASLGRYDAAEVYLKRARDLLRDLGNPRGVALALNGLGLVATRQGDYVTGLSCYAEALDVARRHQLVKLMGTVLANQSVNYALVGQRKRAVTAAEQGVSICAAVGDLVTQSSAAINLAAGYCLCGMHAEAVRWADRALQLCEETGDRVRQCETLIIRSEAHLGRHNCTAAHADIDETARLAHLNGYRYAFAAAERQRSKVLIVEGRAEEAERAATQATEACKRLKDVYRDPLIELLLGEGTCR